MHYVYIGAAPLVILGTTFLDDQLDKHASSTYIAVFQTLFVVGPAVGYVVGGMLLSQHTGIEYSCLFGAAVFYHFIYLQLHLPSSRPSSGSDSPSGIWSTCSYTTLVRNLAVESESYFTNQQAPFLHTHSRLKDPLCSKTRHRVCVKQYAAFTALR